MIFENKLNLPQTDIDRFVKKINIPSDINDCWLWTFNSDKDGYGKFTTSCDGVETRWRAHVFAYSCYNGPIINKLCVLHKCDVRNCVNPNHLFLGTNKDNTIDRNSKNRQAKGEKIGNSILTEFNILQIIQDIENNKYNSIYQICDEYNIEEKSIRSIFNRKTWRHITESISDIDLYRLKRKISSRLDESDIILIKMRLNSGEYYRDIAKDFFVQDQQIYRIMKGKCWADIKVNDIV